MKESLLLAGALALGVFAWGCGGGPYLYEVEGPKAKPYGPDARNVNVTVVDDANGGVRVWYYTIVDPGAYAITGKATTRSLYLQPGRSGVVPVVYRSRSKREDFEHIVLEKIFGPAEQPRALIASVIVAQGHPMVLVSQVQNWRRGDAWNALENTP